MRIRLITLVLICISALFLVRLAYIQLLRGDEYREAADRQYARPASADFSRGTIYFESKNGTRVSAATLIDSYYVAIDPTRITSAEKVCTELRSAASVSYPECIQKASRTNDKYEVVARDLAEEAVQVIRARALPGVTIYAEKERYYPGGSLGAHFLGFVAKTAESGDMEIGRSGLEMYYDDVLRRHAGGLYVNFFAEIFSNLGAVFAGNDNQLDGDVVTTIEPSVQRQLEDTLNQVEKTWKADQIGGIILEPKTGRIVAMAARPTYDPGAFNTVKNQQIFRNPLIENIYEMGSTVKPLAMAAGIDSKAVTPESTYLDTGSVVLDKKTIRNFDGKARGRVSMQEVLNQSLNTGMVYVQQKMGNEAFARYMEGFGFGSPTGIELPNEAEGLVANLSSNRNVNYATAAFGQGIAVTPIQMAAALATLGNGGIRIEPHIVDRIEYRVGITDETQFGKGKQVLKPETSKAISKMLVGVVDTALLNGKAKMEHYSIAAKTGTAQMVNPAKKEYYDDRYLHSFFGYFPAYDPQFLIFLFHTYPKGAQYASATLTDPFIYLTKFLINYYNIPPDR